MLPAMPATNRMDDSTTSRVYDTWSGLYDQTFGRLVHKRQKLAIEHLRLRPGMRVLDLGVGTGVTLPAYPGDVSVVGLDLSPGMLSKAQQKVDTLGLNHVELQQGDALATPFEDGSFDRVLITHVISVVSDPAQLMREAQRLLKPGGRIVVLNHFQSDQPAVRLFQHGVGPLCRRVGWNPTLPFSACLEGTLLRLGYRFKPGVWDLWHLAALERSG